MRQLLALLLLAGSLGPLRAQESAAAAAPPGAAAADASPGAAAAPSVEVAGMRDPEFKTYKDFIAGLDAFDAKRGLAPAAELHFTIRAVDASAGIDGVTMRIAGNETSIAVPIDAAGRFAIPRSQAALDEHAEIMLNRKKGGFRWRPDIHSPGVPAGSRRLGDLRLECEVRWAVEKREMPFFRRTLFGTMGVCSSKQIKVIQFAARPLAGYTLVDGARRVANDSESASAGRVRYVAPLHDQSWPDDTLVELHYQNAQ